MVAWYLQLVSVTKLCILNFGIWVPLCFNQFLIDILYSSDFGMMGEFKQELRDGFIEACLHLVNRDYDALAKDFVTLGYIDYLAMHSAGNFLVTKNILKTLKLHSTGLFHQQLTRKLLQRHWQVFSLSKMYLLSLVLQWIIVCLCLNTILPYYRLLLFHSL